MSLSHAKTQRSEGAKISGKQFGLHYKEYYRVVPWLRGNTVYIVDSIVSMREPEK